VKRHIRSQEERVRTREERRSHRPGTPPGKAGEATPPAAVAASVPAAATAAPAAQTAAASPAPAPLVALPPLVIGVGAQPITPVRSERTAVRRDGRAATGGPAAGSAGSLVAPTIEVATAAKPPAPSVRRAAGKAAPRSRVSTNPLEGIGRRIPLPIPVPDWSKPIIVALLLLAIGLGARAGLAGARARVLERQRAGLLRDVGAMQAALVPPVPSQLGGLDVSVAYRPADGPAAGGDFYDLFSPRPGVVAVLLGDVSGHGHDALTHAALTRYTLRAYVQAGLEPRHALALAGRVLEGDAGERYATVAVGLFEAASGTLTYALAGHPPPIVLRSAGPEHIGACSSPPVGWDLPTGRRQTTISLPADSEICFFSDGLIEARRDGALLGRDSLREILTRLGPSADAQRLLGEVKAVTDGVRDDMVACVLSPRAAAPNEFVRVEELELDEAALEHADVMRFLRECGVSRVVLAQAVHSVGEIALATGSALLRVELAGGAVTVAVSAASAPHATRAAAGSAADALAIAPHEAVSEAALVRALA